MKNFDQFRALWYEKTRHIKIKKETKNYVFVVVYPDKLEWDFSVDKPLASKPLVDQLVLALDITKFCVIKVSCIAH